MKDIVVIPTYNEKENIAVLVPEIFRIIPDIHVMVVDDNSPDQTGALVQSLMKRFDNLSLLMRDKKDGLGKAYIYAFQKILNEGKYQNVIMMDADLSHDPAVLPEMIRQSKDYSVVVGSRYIKNGSIVGWELWRRMLSLFGNHYCRVITRLPVCECTGGFNLMNTELLRRIDFKRFNSSGYAFIWSLNIVSIKPEVHLKKFQLHLRIEWEVSLKYLII